MESIKTLLITQARTGSTRLPGKVLLKVNDDELLKIHLERLIKSKLVDQIIVATTINKEDDVIISLCKKWGFRTSRGAVDDVLDRYYQTANEIKPGWVVRVTSDCPLVDPAMVDAVVAFAQLYEVDYCSNTLIEDFPNGQDVEVFKFSALEKAWLEAKLKSEREHVTPYIKKHSSHNGGTLFSALSFPSQFNFHDIRMTVDMAPDFELVKRLIIDLGIDQSWLTYTNHVINNHLYEINAHIKRNEGFLKSLKND